MSSDRRLPFWAAPAADALAHGPLGPGNGVEDVVVTPAVRRHEGTERPFVGEAELLEHAAHGGVVGRSRGLHALGALARKEPVDELPDRLGAVAAPAVLVGVELDPDLEDAGRERVRRAARVDLAREAPVDVDRELQEAVVEPSGALDLPLDRPLRAGRDRRGRALAELPRLPDGVELVGVERTEGDHGEARRYRFARTSFAAASVATTVSTTLIALPPRSFDSPPARAAMFTGTSSSRRPALEIRISASTSGASVRKGSASSGSAFAFTA